MPATITGIVFNDLNHNGQFDPGEPGIPNAFIVLFSAAAGTCTVIQTDANGNYSFTITVAGTYTVYETVANPGATCPPTAFTQPAGFTMSNGPRKLTLVVTGAQVAGNAVLANNNFSHDTVANPLGCTTSMIQFTGRPSVWFNINIVTGSAVVQGTVNPPVDINAIGYNPLDNYIYGYDQTTNHIVRIDNGGNVITLAPLPPGLPADGYNVGTFDLNGFLYLSVNDGTRFYVVDLRPNSATFLKLVSPANGFLEQTSNFGVALSHVLNVSDWIYRQQDGNLYGITPTGTMERIVPATGTITNLATSPLRTGPFGAAAIDSTGTIYAISNNDGNIYRYTIAGNSATGIRFSSTVTSSFNDATMCALATINLDFGDAPDTGDGNGPDNYSTLLSSDGPRHGLVNGLFLGTRVTAEADAHQNFDATGDDIPLGIQDDGVSVPLPVLSVNEGIYALPVTVTNTTGSPANLYGWVDFTGDGIFQADEAAPVQIVPSQAGTQFFVLHFFPAPGAVKALDHTFVRVRLTTDTLTDTNAPGLPDTRSVGPATDGEVEDYYLQIFNAIEIFITKTPFPAEALPGETVIYRFVLTNPAPFPLTNLKVEDSLLGFIDIVSFLPPFATIELEAAFIVPPDAPAGSVIFNTVVATSDQTLPTKDEAQITVLPAYSLAVTKTPDRISVPPGETVTYEIAVTNTSNAPVFNVVVKDDLVGFAEVVPSLASGESRSFAVPFTVPPGTQAGTVFTNLTVADSNETGPVSDTATIVVPPIPQVYILKSVEPQIAAPGEIVTYTITVSNAGNDTLTNVRIVDPELNVDQTYEAIRPGDAIVITVPFQIPLTAKQGDTFVNVAAVTTSQTGPSQSDAVVKVIGQPSIALQKTVSLGRAMRGENVTYTFVVTNTGNTELTSVRLADPLLGVDQLIGTLAAGESRSIEFPFVVPAAATSPFVNSATVTGLFETQPVTDTDTESLDILIPPPSFTLVKTVDQPQANAGDTVHFLFTIANTGGVALTNVLIADPLLGYANTIESLPAGASVSESIPFTVPPGSPAGSTFINIVTVTTAQTDPQQATASVTVNAEPAIRLTKTADVDNVLPGGTINYTITVANTGNVALTNVVVRDDLLGLNASIASLAIGQSQSFVPAFVVPLATPAGTVILNQSSAFADQTDTVVTDARVLVNPLPPVLTIAKTADLAVVAPGDVVTYSITVSNPGTVVLTGVAVRDDTLGFAQDIGTLNPGDSQTLTVPFTVPADAPAGSVIVNTAVAASDQTDPEEGTSTVTVDPSPGLEVGKTISPAQASPFQTVTATITVANTGNTALTNVVIADAALGFRSVIPTLAVGASVSFPLPFVTPNAPAGTILSNTATAASNETGETPSTATLTVTPEFRLSLIKRAEPSAAFPGDTVTFTFELRNESNAPLTELRFTDDLLGIDHIVDLIPAGLFVLLSRTYTIPEDALGGSIIANTAVLRSAETSPITSTAAVTVLARPSLAISKTVFPPIAFPGEVVFFRMEGVNTGNVPLTNIRYNDRLFGLAGSVVSQNVGEVITLIAPFVIPADAVPGETIVNTVLVDSAQTGPLSAAASVKVADLPLHVTKSADESLAFVGDQVTFTITTANVSQIAVNDAVLTDILQEGAAFIPNSVKVGGNLVLGADPAVGIPLGNLAPGQTIDVVFEANLTDAPADERLENQAAVSFRPADALRRFTIRSNVLVITVEQHEE
ncbi:DUF7507 domain-containing protein [Paenibacillus sacheonensis]|uniref:DUF11 domain-containing protein n=1 Tax=Paenibacillus sacheonensis TaxID=742054 RepID=A0A7X4YRJ4_9BACL|nr:SdrD B-like domain-containing protein [Paenibacillus sacheonensis]MBM7564942.1 putative repeat protein (TIGR01451 family) [Paenibacillus sacheonensis]NBC70269.1 DUF11 domain-containing protein [Paenibacillus sacheonensis]